VADRFIQQAMLQVLQHKWDKRFSDYSYGFRPARRAHHAVAQAQSYLKQGHEWVVDIDLEKFFDRVNHDRLMSALAKEIADKRVLKVMRAFPQRWGHGKRSGKCFGAGSPARGTFVAVTIQHCA
jgi:RNA-directed DNA polymerase